jgi:hypothetical protein
MLSQTTTPHKAFSDVTEAVRWATEPLRLFQDGRRPIDDAVEVVVRKRRFLTERA